MTDQFGPNGGFIATPMMQDIHRLEGRIAELEKRLAVLENPPCCKGGPQWGHAWDCSKCPD